MLIGVGAEIGSVCGESNRGRGGCRSRSRVRLRSRKKTKRGY